MQSRQEQNSRKLSHNFVGGLVDRFMPGLAQVRTGLATIYQSGDRARARGVVLLSQTGHEPIHQFPHAELAHVHSTSMSPTLSA
jgi:hypothetical protein